MKRTNTETIPTKKPRSDPNELDPSKSKATLGTKQVITTSSTEVEKCYFDKGEFPIEVLKEIFSRYCSTATSIYTLIKVSKYLNELINQYIEETLTLKSNLKSYFHPFEQKLLPDFENANYGTAITLYQYSLYNPENPVCARFKKIFKQKLKCYIKLWSNNTFQFSKSDDTYQLSIAENKTLNFNINNNDEVFILQKFLKHYFYSDNFIAGTVFKNKNNDELLTTISTYNKKGNKKEFLGLFTNLVFHLYKQFENTHDSHAHAHLRLCTFLVTKKLVFEPQGIELGNLVIRKLGELQNTQTSPQTMKFCTHLIALLNILNYNNLLKPTPKDTADLKDLVLHNIQYNQFQHFPTTILSFLDNLLTTDLIKLEFKDINIVKDFVIETLKAPQHQALHYTSLLCLRKLHNKDPLKLSPKDAAVLKGFIITTIKDPQAHKHHSDSLGLLGSLIKTDQFKLSPEEAAVLKGFIITTLKDPQAQALCNNFLGLLGILIITDQLKLSPEEAADLKGFSITTLKDPQAQALHNNFLRHLDILLLTDQFKLSPEEAADLKGFIITTLKDPQAQELHNSSLALLIALLNKNQLKLSPEEAADLKGFSITTLKVPQAQALRSNFLKLLSALLNKNQLKLSPEEAADLKDISKRSNTLTL